MRILIITANYLDGTNGVAISTKQQIENLKNRGHEVTLITPRHFGEAVGDNAIGTLEIPAPFYVEFPMVTPLMISRIKDLPEVRRAEIIYFHNPLFRGMSALKLAKLLDIPAVFFYHTKYDKVVRTLLPNVIGGLLSSLIRGRVKRVILGANAVIVETESVFEELKEQGLANRVSVIPTGRKFANKKKLSKENLRLKYRIPVDKVVILLLCRISREKNIESLISIFGKLKKKSGVMLLIVGDGSEKTRLERRCKERGVDNVRFEGKVDFAVTADYYQLADIFAYPSLNDTQAIVLLEAMSFGLPLVGFRASGPVDFIDHGENGYIANNNKDFLVYLKELIKNSVLRRKMGRLSYQKSQDFSLEKTVDKTERLFKKVIEEYRGKTKS